MASVGELRIDHERERSRQTIALAGELDLVTSPALSEAVDRALDSGVKELTLDLRGLVFMDSSGLRALLASWDACRARRCELRVIPDRGACLRLFEITGVIDELPLSEPPLRPAPGAVSAQRRD